jgi:hypothetical protein
MSFGLHNTVQTFKHFMDILRGLDFCFAYVDDILVFSQSLEHEEHPRTLFNQLQTYGIVINTAKCVFQATKVTFLGYKVSAKGSQPLDERVTISRTATLQKLLSAPLVSGHSELLQAIPAPAAATQAPLHGVLSGPRVKGSTPSPGHWSSSKHSMSARRVCHEPLY